VKRLADLLEEPNAELLLKLAYLPRYGRLGEEDLLGRPGVIQVLPDGEEGAKVTRVHRLSKKKRMVTDIIMHFQYSCEKLSMAITGAMRECRNLSGPERRRTMSKSAVRLTQLSSCAG
jgi:hypothetical protein